MSYATLDELRSQLGGKPTVEVSAAYAAKMLHDLPEPKTVDREKFVLEHCRGKRVLEFGASGPMSMAIRKVAEAFVGVDREGNGNELIAFDLDDVAQPSLPACNPEVIVCGEVLEHLGNPQWFLTRLRRQYAGVPVIITVPNAYATAGKSWLAKGKENVNKDHVAWYSPTVLATLLERVGYTYAGLYYYNGDGPTAEGLVVVTE